MTVKDALRLLKKAERVLVEALGIDYRKESGFA